MAAYTSTINAASTRLNVSRAPVKFGRAAAALPSVTGALLTLRGVLAALIVLV